MVHCSDCLLEGPSVTVKPTVGLIVYCGEEKQRAQCDVWADGALCTNGKKGPKNPFTFKVSKDSLGEKRP